MDRGECGAGALPAEQLIDDLVALRQTIRGTAAAEAPRPVTSTLICRQFATLAQGLWTERLPEEKPAQAFAGERTSVLPRRKRGFVNLLTDIFRQAPQEARQTQFEARLGSMFDNFYDEVLDLFRREELREQSPIRPDVSPSRHNSRTPWNPRPFQISRSASSRRLSTAASCLAKSKASSCDLSADSWNPVLSEQPLVPPNEVRRLQCIKYYACFRRDGCAAFARFPAHAHHRGPTDLLSQLGSSGVRWAALSQSLIAAHTAFWSSEIPSRRSTKSPSVCSSWVGQAIAISSARRARPWISFQVTVSPAPAASGRHWGLAL